ncbi:MAG TPA: thermopsin family protease [Thermoplasmata archaeon]|nr:thermopsin family protease [Thermoplasmata archaeon]
MGITDYGVTPSLGSYTYRTNEVESFVDISTLHVNQSNGASCLDGNAAWCMGFQSNWVTEGVKVHNVAHDYWTQDVAQVAYDSSCSSPCVSGTYSVTWLDNIWNFSAPGCTTLTGKGCMNAGDLTGNGHLRCSSHGGAPTFYYCVGATVYDLRLPFTVWTFMSVGTNGGTPSKSQVNFYGAVVKGNAYHYGFTYDTVNFTSGSAGGGTPMFQVKNSNTPYGIPFDGEWDICGPAGGASVTIGSIAATLESYYYHAGWVSIKHAWSSGYDTAESAYYVNLYAFGGFRYTASAATGTENPATSLW